MSIKTRIAALALATLAVTGAFAASTQSAHAGPNGKMVAAGLLGAAVVGTAIAAGHSHYYHPVRHCAWKPRFNAFGQFIGHVRVCHYH